MDLKVLDLKPSALEIIERHFHRLYSGELGLSSIKGGQSAANLALKSLDITRYAEQRSEVLPLEKRGATVLSPYIRHNLLTLDQVYRAVKGAPFKDRE
ncbi:MAG: deoxyribodipyrimidine photolyase, partial [Actinomycetota bacterium]|nr:deoxyribodipyrimidine photolyase [Actinomycetota bacterium]